MSQLPTDGQGNIIRYNPNTGQYEPQRISIMPNSGQPSHDFNPATGLSREQYRDNWMSSGISNIDQMQQWLAQNGGSILSGNGTVQTPYGDILDMGTAFRTGNGTPGWTPVNGGPGTNQAQGSVLGSSGNMLGSLLQMLMGGTGQQQNPGAMPYNPHQQQGGLDYGKMGGSIGSRPMQPQQPNQTNGTVLGTRPVGNPMGGSIGGPAAPITTNKYPGRSSSWMSPSGMANFYRQPQPGINGSTYGTKPGGSFSG
jgi:hypothetical protein